MKKKSSKTCEFKKNDTLDTNTHTHTHAYAYRGKLNVLVDCFVECFVTHMLDSIQVHDDAHENNNTNNEHNNGVNGPRKKPVCQKSSSNSMGKINVNDKTRNGNAINVTNLCCSISIKIIKTLRTHENTYYVFDI